MDPELAEKIRKKNARCSKWKMRAWKMQPEQPPSPRPNNNQTTQSLFKPLTSTRKRSRRNFKSRKGSRNSPNHQDLKPITKKITHHAKSVQPSRQNEVRLFAPVRRRSSEELVRLTYASPTTKSSTASKTQPDNDMPDFKPGKTKILSKIVYDLASIYDEYIGYDLFLKEMNMQSWNKKEIICSFHMDFIPDMDDLHDYVCQYGNVKFIQYENYKCNIGPPEGVTIGRIVFLEEPWDIIFAIDDGGRHVMENEVIIKVYKSMHDFEMTKYITMKRRKERREKQKAKRKRLNKIRRTPPSQRRLPYQ